MSVQIDQILIKVGSGHNMVTLGEWNAMLLTERIEAIREQRVTFLSGGQPVPAREAIKAIKDQAGVS